MKTTSANHIRIHTIKPRITSGYHSKRKYAPCVRDRKINTQHRHNTGASWRIRAEAEAETNATETKQQYPKIELGPEFVPVCLISDVPKGTRKQVIVESKPVLLFWYRNELFGIESRSTAEGYYSEGFMKAKFTQDYGILCPTTSTVFSIRDGSILEWYPNNPVLRQLTPKDTCRPIEIYPVEISEDTVYVNPEGTLKDWNPESGLRSDFIMPGQISSSKGGADSSAEGNNVYGIEPKMYLEGTSASDPVDEFSSGTSALTPATVIVGTIAAGIIGVAGTGVCLYYENFVVLAIFWLLGISAVGLIAQKYTDIFE